MNERQYFKLDDIIKVQEIEFGLIGVHSILSKCVIYKDCKYSCVTCDYLIVKDENLCSNPKVIDRYKNER